MLSECPFCISKCARLSLRASKIFWGGMPPDPPRWLRATPTPTFTHHTSASYKINSWLCHCFSFTMQEVSIRNTHAQTVLIRPLPPPPLGWRTLAKKEMFMQVLAHEKVELEHAIHIKQNGIALQRTLLVS